MTAAPDQASDTDDAHPLWWLPNALTFARFALALAAAVAVIAADGASPPSAFAWNAVAFASFALAAGTDWLDGSLARRWRVESRLGALLDPIADKALIWCLLLAFAARADFAPVIVTPVALIIGRDVAITSLRLTGSAHTRRAMTVSFSAKLKTVAQMALVGTPLLAAMAGRDLFSDDTPNVWWTIALWATALYTVAVGAVYVRKILAAQRRK